MGAASGQQEVYDEDDRYSASLSHSHGSLMEEWKRCGHTGYELMDVEGMCCRCCGQECSPALQWVYYQPVFDQSSTSIVGKKPKGRFCRPCQSTFKAAGWDTTYGTLTQHMQFASKPTGRATHVDFISKRQAWVKSHQGESAGKWLRSSAKRAIGETELELQKGIGRRAVTEGCQLIEVPYLEVGARRGR